MKKGRNIPRMLILPVLIIFGIITINQGGFGNGGYNTLYLQPTVPYFQHVNYGSVYFNARPFYTAPTYHYSQPSFVGFNYASNIPFTQPVYGYSRPSQFYVRSYAIPAEPIYTTPTRTLFNVNYAYSNVGKVWGY